jgi:hypothetical protein
VRNRQAFTARQPWTQVFATVMLCLLAACKNSDGCHSDRDCKGDRVCDSGRCVAPPAAGSEVPSAPPPAATEPPLAPAAPAGVATAPSRFVPTTADAIAWAHRYKYSAAFKAKLGEESVPEDDEWRVFMGDIDNDGRTDAVVDLTFVPEGGNAPWHMGIAVLHNDGAALQHAGTIDFPDEDGRDGTQTVDAIRGGRLHLTEHIYEQEDPRCCPSLERKVSYALVDGRLVRSEEPVRKLPQDEP